MPYKLRKAPKKELYWVVNTENGNKHSILPIAKDVAQRQMNLLRGVEHGWTPTRKSTKSKSPRLKKKKI